MILCAILSAVAFVVGISLYIIGGMIAQPGHPTVGSTICRNAGVVLSHGSIVSGAVVGGIALFSCIAASVVGVLSAIGLGVCVGLAGWSAYRSGCGLYNCMASKFISDMEAAVSAPKPEAASA